MVQPSLSGRHPLVPDLPCAGRVHGNGKLAFPVEVAAGVAHFEVSSPGLLELDHVADVRCNPRADDTFVDFFGGREGEVLGRGDSNR